MSADLRAALREIADRIDDGTAEYAHPFHQRNAAHLRALADAPATVRELLGERAVEFIDSDMLGRTRIKVARRGKHARALWLSYFHSDGTWGHWFPIKTISLSRLDALAVFVDMAKES